MTTPTDAVRLREGLLEAALDSVITMDARGLVVDWNPAAERTFGYPRDEALGQPLAHLIIPEPLRARHEQGLKRYLDTGEGRILNQRLELEALRKGGGLFPCELTIHPVNLSSGVHFTAYLRDLSEVKAREHRLEQATRRAMALTDAMSALASAQTPKDVAAAILDHSLQAVGAYGGSVFVRNGNLLETLGYRGFANSAVFEQYQTFGLHAPVPAADVARTGEALHLSRDDIQQRYPVVNERLHEDTGSMVVVPLQVGAAVIGALAFSFRGTLPAHAEDHAFVGHLAFQCAQTLNRVNLTHEISAREERYRSLIEATSQIVWTRSPDGEFLTDQPQWRAFTGQSEEEILGLGWFRAIHPDDQAGTDALWTAAKTRAVPVETEYRLRRFDGAYRVMHVRGVPVCHADGRIREWVGVHQDVTEEREAQQQTAALLAVTAALAETHTAAEAAEIILRHVRATLGAYAGSVLSLAGQTFHTVGMQGYGDEVRSAFASFPLDAPVPIADAVRDLRPRYVSHAQIRQDYPAVAAVLVHDEERLAAVPLIVGGAAVGGLVLSFADGRAFAPKEREFIESFAYQCARALANVQAFDAARDSEARMAGIVSTVSDAVVTTDSERRILVFNQAAEQMFNISAADALGTPLDRFIPPQFHDAHARHMRTFGETGVTARRMHGGREALPALRHGGEAFLVEATISQVVVGEDRLFTAVIRDVSQQRHAEQALRDSEERFRSTFDQAAVGIAHLDLDGRWLSVNGKLCDIVGYTEAELLNLTFQDITHPDDLNADLELVGQLVSGQLKTYSLQKRYIRKSGAQVWINLTVSLVRAEDGQARYFISVVEDISDIKEAEEALRAAHNSLEERVHERTNELQVLSRELQRQVAELELVNTESRLLGDMSEMLQACFSVKEAQEVVAQHAARLFPQAAGALYSFGASRNVLEEGISWNGTVGGDPIFAPVECWGLRRGRLFATEGVGHGPVCAHIGTEQPTVCVPLLAQSETVGLLHLVAAGGPPFTARQQRLAQTVAETVALAFMNLGLRETLRQQSIRDGLTGLFNRRYLEETFERESRRANRHEHPMGIVMLDVDHFKSFNDRHGHEAGDALLRELGTVLKTSIRGEDVACRYGGEEFSLLLPGANLEQTLARAEEVREAVQRMRVESRGQPLDRVTISLGVAAYPHHGTSLHDLLRAADLALYRAKQEGRNRSQAAPER
ncbi:PAS domain S-box protein [Deinococcus hohokamensis]|uniref:PAS domain S-box protein n=1 Tax=Deinococcus hohokamensis TaxID=309883 RepID=A0ABV9I689_9DEIO